MRPKRNEYSNVRRPGRPPILASRRVISLDDIYRAIEALDSKVDEKFREFGGKLRELESKLDRTTTSVHPVSVDSLFDRDAIEYIQREGIDMDLVQNNSLVYNNVNLLTDVLNKSTSNSRYGTKLMDILFTKHEMAQGTVDPRRDLYDKVLLDKKKIDLIKLCFIKRMGHVAFDQYWPTLRKSLRQKCLDIRRRLNLLETEEESSDSYEPSESDYESSDTERRGRKKRKNEASSGKGERPNKQYQLSKQQSSRDDSQDQTRLRVLTDRHDEQIKLPVKPYSQQQALDKLQDELREYERLQKQQRERDLLREKHGLPLPERNRSQDKLQEAYRQLQEQLKKQQQDQDRLLEEKVLLEQDRLQNELNKLYRLAGDLQEQIQMHQLERQQEHARAIELKRLEEEDDEVLEIKYYP